MDNIRDRWNEVNGRPKSLHVDKQMFIEKITPYCIMHAQMEFQRVNVMSIP